MAGVVATTDWANLTVAGAFILGAILATIATLKVMGLAISYLKRQDRDQREP